jgi:hypothetical protein
MKVSITGHTQGLGKGLFDYFSKDHSVLGFSRTNGFEISRFYEVIVNKSLDSDVFINNTCVADYQFKMFNLLLDKWKNDGSKTIVNIGSICKFDRGLNPTATEKHKLAEQSMKASLDDDNIKCRIISATIGPISSGWKKDMKNILTIDECVQILSYAINLPQHIELAEISFWTLDNKVNKTTE